MASPLHKMPLQVQGHTYDSSDHYLSNPRISEIHLVSGFYSGVIFVTPVNPLYQTLPFLSSISDLDMLMRTEIKMYTFF